MKVISTSCEQTMEQGERLAKQLKGNEIVLLGGDLGAGKTTFCKGLAKGLGVQCVVNSPTFTILKSYEGRLKLNHFDMYRVDEQQCLDSGLDEMMFEQGSVAVIEWWQNVRGLIPHDSILVDICVIDEGTRSIEIGKLCDSEEDK